MAGGGSPQVRRKTGEGNDVTKHQEVGEQEKLKLGSGVRRETESQDFITTTTGEYETLDSVTVGHNRQIRLSFLRN